MQCGASSDYPGQRGHCRPHDRHPSSPCRWPACACSTLARARRPLVHADAGRPGRRRDQGRTPAARRASAATTSRAAGARPSCTTARAATPPRRPTTWAPTATSARSRWTSPVRKAGAPIRRLAARSDVFVGMVGRRHGPLRPGQRQPARAQPAPRLPLDHRLRPDRALPRPRRLRLRGAGHGRPDERDRSRQEIADDTPGGPQKVGVAVADLFTGMYASTASSLRRHRDLSGCGQRSTWRCSTPRWRCSPTRRQHPSPASAPQRAGNAHQNIVPYRVFEVADGT